MNAALRDQLCFSLSLQRITDTDVRRISVVRLPQAWRATNTTEGGCDPAVGERSVIHSSTNWRRLLGVTFEILYVKDPWLGDSLPYDRRLSAPFAWVSDESKANTCIPRARRFQER